MDTEFPFENLETFSCWPGKKNMEIIHMNSIYFVNHIHMYYHNRLKNIEYFDRKPIGFFYSKEEALRLIDLYRTLPGFKDHQNGFYIDEYVIDSVYNEKINTLLCKNIPIGKQQKVLFSIWYQYEDEDGDNDEFEILAFFSTKAKAKSGLNELLKMPDIKLIKDKLSIIEEPIDRKAWGEGFATWQQSRETAAKKAKQD